MFEALLQKIAQGLDSRGIPYMLIGGQAVLIYGEPRFTRVVDVILGVAPDKLPVILEWIRESSWQVLVQAPADFVQQTFVLPCADSFSGIRMDLIFSISPFERHAIGRSRGVDIGGTPVRFAAPEDLIIFKVIAGRPRDLEDARSILLKQPGVDVPYVRRWLREMEAGQEELFLSRFEGLLP